MKDTIKTEAIRERLVDVMTQIEINRFRWSGHELRAHEAKASQLKDLLAMSGLTIGDMVKIKDESRNAAEQYFVAAYGEKGAWRKKLGFEKN